MHSGLPAKIGEQVGSWRLVKLLGEGGMSIVYLGHHAWLAQEGAVKMLRPQFCSDPSALRRFEQEALTAGQLQHKNIIKVQDFGQDTLGRHYMVLELLEGADLESVIEQAPFPLRWIAEIFRQVCSALKMTHEAGILHRDLKPSNIFLLPVKGDDNPHVKLLDFGVAKVLQQDEDTKLTRTGAIIGTPAYLAPEQVIPKKEPTIAADIYALGVLLYQCLAGQLPIEGSNMIEHAMLVMQDTPPALGEHREAFDGTKLESLLVDMLRKDPSKRPHDISDVQSRFDDALSELEGLEESDIAVPVLHVVPVSVGSDMTFQTQVCELHDTAQESALPTVRESGKRDTVRMADGVRKYRPLPTGHLEIPVELQGVEEGEQSKHDHADEKTIQSSSWIPFGGIVGVVVVCLLGVFLWRSFPSQPSTTPKKSTQLGMWVMEGVKSFRRREYSQAIAYWKKATSHKGWKQSRYFPVLYKRMGIGYARQNMLYSAVSLYRRYVKATKQSVSPDDTKQQLSLAEEIKQLNGFARELKKRIQTGFRILAELQKSSKEERWSKSKRFFLELQKATPSVPDIQLKLVDLVALAFPQKALLMVKKILDELELTHKQRAVFEKKRLSLQMEIARRENEVERLLRSIRQMPEAERLRVGKRLLTRRLSSRRHLTLLSTHKRLSLWGREIARQRLHSAVVLLRVVVDKLHTFETSGLVKWIAEDKAVWLSKKQLQQQIKVLQSIKRQRRLYAALQKKWKRGRFFSTKRGLVRFARSTSQLQKIDRWELLRVLLPGAEKSLVFAGKFETLRATYRRSKALWRQARFKQAHQTTLVWTKVLQGTAAALWGQRFLRGWLMKRQRATRSWKKGQAAFRQKRWRVAQRHLRLFLRLFPHAWNAKKVRHQLKTCRCGIGGVPWENCKGFRKE